MKKVLFIAPPYINIEAQTGGVFQEMLLREQALSKVGIDVEYLSLQSAPNWNEIDIVHLFMANEGSYGLASKVKEYKKLIVSPIIDRTENSDFLKYLIKVMEKVPLMHSNLQRTKQICQIADGLMVRSSEEKDRVKNVFNCTQNIKVIESPIEILMESRLESLERKKQVLFVGDAGNPRKNIIKLIEQVNKHNYKLVIAGRISEGNYGNKVKYLIELSNNIIHLGLISDKKKYELMHTSKVFALPSTMEGIGLSAMEAFICNCKMCVTKNGGISDYLKDNAFYINPYSSKSLYDGLKYAMDSKDDNNRKIFDKFSFEEIGEKMKVFYKKVLNNEHIN